MNCAKNARRSLAPTSSNPRWPGSRQNSRRTRTVPRKSARRVRAPQNPARLPRAHRYLSAVEAGGHLCAGSSVAAPRGRRSALFAKASAKRNVARWASTGRTALSQRPAGKPLRMMEHIDDSVGTNLPPITEQIRGGTLRDELIVLDGKQPRWAFRAFTSATVPSQHDLGSAIVVTRPTEIPVAQELFKELIFRRLQSQPRHSAAHPRTRPRGDLVLAHGSRLSADRRNNQPTVRARHQISQAPPAKISPSGSDIRWRASVRSTKASPNGACCFSRAATSEVEFPAIKGAGRAMRRLRQHSRSLWPWCDAAYLRNSTPRAMAVNNRATQSISGYHLAHGHLPPGRPVPGAPSQGNAIDGDVPANQQQPVHGVAQPTEKASAQNDHRFLQRHERRTSSLCHSLHPCPPAQLPNRFMNWPCGSRQV